MIFYEPWGEIKIWYQKASLIILFVTIHTQIFSKWNPAHFFAALRKYNSLLGGKFIFERGKDFSRKELSFCHKLKFSNPYFFVNLILNLGFFIVHRSHNLKYQRYDIGLHSYRDHKFRVYGKISFPLQLWYIINKYM